MNGAVSTLEALGYTFAGRIEKMGAARSDSSDLGLRALSMVSCDG
jgi:hypothetical protein